MDLEFSFGVVSAIGVGTWRQWQLETEALPIWQAQTVTVRLAGGVVRTQSLVAPTAAGESKPTTPGSRQRLQEHFKTRRCTHCPHARPLQRHHPQPRERLLFDFGSTWVAEVMPEGSEGIKETREEMSEKSQHFGPRETFEDIRCKVLSAFLLPWNPMFKQNCYN